MEQIDYKKKYEEAIERLKQWDREHSSGYAIKERDEFIFPELRESEDERIKKAIIEIVKKDEERIGVNAHLKKLQWLKNQGEQKPDNWLQELEDKLANATPKQLAEWKEKYFKEEPAEWSEEDEEMLNQVIEDIIKLAGPYVCYRKDVDWLKSLRPRSQWKPSNEQLEALANAISLAKNCGEESAFDLTTLYEQLKKLREE